MAGPRPAAVLAAAGAALLVAVAAVMPYRDGSALAVSGAPAVEGQALEVAAIAEPAVTRRDALAAEVSPERQRMALIADRTNYAWARLVLWYGGWPITDDSVATITEWMRAENGVDSWYLRNNPLNNGWGTDTGDFLGSYPTLQEAAAEAAEALSSYGNYSGIRASFASGGSGSRDAIIASPWATGHYNNGAHWHTGGVPAVEAPPEAWGF